MTLPVVFHDVSKRFGQVTALRELSFSVGRGEAFILMGPNGSGKTTAVKLCLGLLEPTSGYVKVFGKPPSRLGRRERRRVGVLLDKHCLVEDISVEKNLLVAASVYGLSMGEARDRVRLVASNLGIEEVLDKRVAKLSKGFKQRVALARAFLPDPELLVLDEPTVNLDVEVQARVWGLLKDYIRRGRTVFMTSHNPVEAEELGARVVVLRRGEVLESGLVGELSSRLGVPFREAYRSMLAGAWS